jgi:Flp pilus assembly protein TadG
MLRRIRRRRRDERGAMAVLIAGLSTVLLIVAAMGVDLGNAWQRKITVQKSVDVSAISAGALLPMTAANADSIYAEVASYLNRASNKVIGQPGSVTGAQLHDNDLANGEVTFPDKDTMNVVAPQAHVDYGLANIIGFDSTQVTADATVQIRTPLPAVESVLPIWVPATCVYGPLAGDVAANPPPSASPTYTNNSPRNTANVLTALTPTSMTYGTTGQTLSIVISAIPAGKTGAILRFSFGNTKYIDYRVTWATATTDTDNSRTVTVNLDEADTTKVARTPSDATVPSTTGDWQVWPLIPTSPAPPALPLAASFSNPEFPKNNTTISKFTVLGGGEVECNDHTRGNFGQLDSPRKDTNQKQTAYAENVAFGLDHQLAQFVNAPSNECQSDGNPAGAKIDDDTSDGNNCLYVDPGNDPQGLTDGLLGGGRITEGEGRLQKPTNPACNRPNLVMDGKNLNNDTLSCYLKPGYTLADITKNSGVPFDALDVSIYDSPRFFWVPVVYAGDRMLKKYLAIKTFAPVFLTDETGTSPASSTNGLVLNPGGKVQSVQIFGFNADALPIKPNADTIPFQDGGRKVVRLID